MLMVVMMFTMILKMFIRLSLSNSSASSWGLAVCDDDHNPDDQNNHTNFNYDLHFCFLCLIVTPWGLAIYDDDDDDGYDDAHHNSDDHNNNKVVMISNRFYVDDGDDRDTDKADIC